MRDRIEELIKNIRFPHYPMPIDLQYIRSPVRWESPLLRITLITKDRESGAPSTITNTHDIPPMYIGRLGLDEFLVWLRGKIRDIVCHEVEEHMLLNGVRIFDPHSIELHGSPELTKELIDNYSTKHEDFDVQRARFVDHVPMLPHPHRDPGSGDGPSVDLHRDKGQD